MNLKNIPFSYQPAYMWQWNGTITEDGIKKQIDSMYNCGIRAMYIIGMPENFRPEIMTTSLKPEYMSQEYLDLLFYAYEYAKEKGIYTWLYNEGGYPSGMVCGQIREQYPHLAIKKITVIKECHKAGVPFKANEKLISAFCGERRINDGEIFDSDCDIISYIYEDNMRHRDLVRSDIAQKENTKHFLELTHEKLKSRFQERMGNDITLMFDDESFMGTWTLGLEKLFLEKYGYEIETYLPVIAGEKAPKTDCEYRAKSDYIMLCGELVCENYYKDMRKWLNENNMLSTGHLDNDHCVGGVVGNLYGNRMALLRSFDVPGIDVIWGQIDFPTDGRSCPMGNEFFPRIASSAARQQGHSRCMSESFAVYGAQLTGEQYRYIINFQAVKGISLFNFMSISYVKEAPISLQVRPSFGEESIGMDTLSEINDYTARLSYILQNSHAEIDTAIYCPYRSICAGGEKGKEAVEKFEKMGNLLEMDGVSFDIIDEEFVKNAVVENGMFKGEFVTYKNVFVSEMTEFEKTEIILKLKKLSTPVKAKNICTNKYIKSRKLKFDDGNQAYFICNTDRKKVQERIEIPTQKNIYEIGLNDGEIYEINSVREEEKVYIDIELLRGEGKMILLSDNVISAKKRYITGKKYELCEFSSYISRQYIIDSEKGIQNLFFDDANAKPGFIKGDKSFSGEITYICELKDIPSGCYLLKIKDIKYSAKIYLNDVLKGVTTMPPYGIVLNEVKMGDVLKIVVANTIANACVNTEFFGKHNEYDVGPYHQNMVKREVFAENPQLCGPVILEKILNS